jgi:hypothetical protein
MALVAEMVLGGLGLVTLTGSLADAFQALRERPMLIDIDTYAHSARQMTYFFDTQLREPLHPFWFKLGFLLSDDVKTVPRQVTALQTLVLAVGLYGFCRAHLGILTAITVMWALAFNYTVHFYGVSGLRDTLYSAQMVWFFWFMFLPWGTHAERRITVSSAVTACLLYLTRVYGLLQVLGAVGWWVLQERSWRAAVRKPVLGRALKVVTAAVVILLMDRVLRGPNNVGLDVAYWWSRENQGVDPQDHKLRMGMLGYIFDNRSLWDVLVRVVDNHVLYVKTYLPSFCHGYHEAAPMLLVLGVLFALALRKSFIPVMAVSALAPVVFVLNLSQQPTVFGVDKRLVMPAFVLSLPLMAWACWTILELTLHGLAIRFPVLRETHARYRRWHIGTADADRSTGAS